MRKRASMPEGHGNDRDRAGSDERRGFLKGGLALAAGLGLLSAGALVTVVRYFLRPKLSKQAAEQLGRQRLEHLKTTFEEETLKLERRTQKSIAVAKLSELDATTGKYFVDAEMAPALAFLDGDGLPLLLSARCTHLGCTVGNQVDEKGKILCPCHISYFDIKTGEPSPGSPARRPLPHIAWILKDAGGKNVLASSAAPADARAAAAAKKLEGSVVYIVAGTSPS
ncbi:MAG TPA: Rieske (2Fe-2S) protein [Chroococcales cyanobacterium]